MTILSSLFFTFMVCYLPSLSFFTTWHSHSFEESKNVFFILCKESYFQFIQILQFIQVQNSRAERLMADPKKALWKLSIPIMLGMAVQTIYATTDMIFVGQISSLAIAALGFNAPLIFFSMGISFGIGSGVTSLIARYTGAGNSIGVSKAAANAVQLSFLLAFGLTIAGLLFHREVFVLLGATSEIIPEAEKYFIITSVGSLFSVGAIIYRSIFNGEGNTHTPMIFQAIATIMNIILDPIFIFIFDMGLSGAALATVLSQAFVMFSLFYHAQIKKKISADFFPYINKFHLREFKSTIKIGLPASFSMIIMSLGSALFNYFLIRFSPEAVAGYQIGGRIDHIFFVPIIAIGSALVTMVGMLYGAKDKNKIYKIVRYGVSNAIYIAIIFGIIFYWIAPYFVRLFSPDLMVQNYAIGYVRTIIFAFPFVAVGLSSGRILQGLGLGMPSLIITGVRVLFVAAPSSFLFVFVLNKPMNYIWYSMVFSSMVAAVISLTWLIRRLKKLPDSISVNTNEYELF